MISINKTNIEHGSIAILLQVILICSFLLVPTDIALAVSSIAFSVGVFFGREHAQFERKLKDKNKETDISWNTTLKAMKFWTWSMDAQLDLYVPVLFSTVIGILYYLLI